MSVQLAAAAPAAAELPEVAGLQACLCPAGAPSVLLCSPLRGHRRFSLPHGFCEARGVVLRKGSRLRVKYCPLVTDEPHPEQSQPFATGMGLGPPPWFHGHDVPKKIQGLQISRGLIS